MSVIKTRLWLVAAVTVSIMTGCQQAKEEVKEKPLDLKNEDVQAAYIIGVNMGKNIGQNIDSFKDIDMNISREIIIKGFEDGLKGSVKLTDEQIATGIKAFEKKITSRLEAKSAKESLDKSNAYLKENGAKEGVVTTASGLQYKILRPGTGAKPGPKDKVKVHYKGTLVDGKKFDSSYDRKTPATFGVSGVIPGWTEALQLMKKGAKWQLTIPSDLAYGPKGRPGIPPYAVLLFDVELLDINPKVETAKKAVKDEDPKPEKDPAK